MLRRSRKGLTAAWCGLVGAMPAFAAERMMVMEIEAKVAVPAGARTAARLKHRDGSREWGWDTRAGRIELAIPKLGTGSDASGFLEPRRTADKAPAAMIQEVHIQGVSTRSVGDPVRAMGASGVTKREVSRLVTEVDQRLNA